MLLLFCVVLIAGALALTFWVRPSDLPQVEPMAPWQHLEDRKARIYENLRDLQFEFRVGKLSDEDYQRTKKILQVELAGTLAEIDQLKAAVPPAPSPAPAPAKKHSKKNVCPHCKAEFDKFMKFCGECGKAMQG
jgi:hypothetical protein